MKLLLFAVLILVSVGDFIVEDPDYRPAFLHRNRGARIGVQLPQTDSDESQEEIGKSVEVEENDNDLIVDEEEEKSLKRSRRDTSDEINDGPGGTFEVKDSTDGQEGDDSLVELGDGRFGDSDGQGKEGSGRFRRMLLADSQESRRFPARRRPFGIKHHCKIDKEGKRKCFQRQNPVEDQDPEDEQIKSLKAKERRGRRALSSIQFDDQEFDESQRKPKDVKPWLRRGQDDDETKKALQRKTFRRRCQIGGKTNRKRCFPRPERPLESPRKENRGHRRSRDQQL